MTTIPSIPDVPSFGGVKSLVLQNATADSSNGADFDIEGYATVVLLVVPDTTYDGVVDFKISPDGVTFGDIRGSKIDDGTLATNVTCTGNTPTIWTFQVAGNKWFRAPTVDVGGTDKVTVTGFASNDANFLPLAATITSTVLGAGSNLVGGVNVTDYNGTNQLAVDSNHNLAASVRVGTTPVPAGHGTAATALRVELPTDGTGVVGLNAGTEVVGSVMLQAVSGTALAADATDSELRVSTYVTTTNPGDTALTLGQGVMAASLPVTIASDQSDVGVVPHAGATGGATPYHLSTATSDNATNVKNAAGSLYGYAIHNTTANTVEFVKFYNKASTPAPATDNALLTWIVRVPGASQVTAYFPVPINFATGIGFATVTGSGDTDDTGITAGDLIINLIYK